MRRLDYRSQKEVTLTGSWPKSQDLTESIACNNSNYCKLAEYIPKPLDLIQFLPEVPMGDVAGVPLWTLSPNDWEAAAGRGWGAAPEGPGRGPGMGPGGVSLCGDVRGVLRGVPGCDVCPPASRASRLLRILKEHDSRCTYSLEVLWRLTVQPYTSSACIIIRLLKCILTIKWVAICFCLSG